MTALATRLRPFGTTIFAEMTQLAQRTGAVNLGQGFPDADGPAEIVEAAVAALRAGHNQYAPANGVPALRAAVADHQRRFYGLDVDPDHGVLVTFGATEAIASAVIGLCEPGDEVIALDPAYDSYAAVAAMAGATLKRVPLRPPAFALDSDALRAAVGPRTRAVLLNSPHNPTGRVLNSSELAAVAAVCRDFDLLAICDEVYEHLVFAGEHVPLATLPDMAERTLTISSLGKTYSFTGWKIGWASGPRELVGAAAAVKQFLSFAGGTPLQHAAAAALALGPGSLAAELQAKRDRLCAGLRAAGFEVHVPDGTYFVQTDIGALGGSDGVAFCWALPERAGVVAVPTAVFYEDPSIGRTLVRFAFCKREEVIDEAVRRLARLQPA
jgi:N-succinyldiaminopimelate aminotransferase